MDRYRPESWIQAATILLTKPGAIVVCPHCHVGTLVAHEVVVESDPEFYSLYLECVYCGRTEIADRLRRPRQA